MEFDLHLLIATYGYWLILLTVGLESMGVPLPGETTLVAGAVYAGTTGRLDIELVLAAAAAGAVVGDNLGYWLGRRLGFPLMLRHGPRVGLTESRMKLGQYLFLRHGGKIVFFGRFVALLRTFAALLAGINRMAWPQFLLWNFLGGIVWAAIFGLGGHWAGAAIHRVAGPFGIALGGTAFVLFVACGIAARRHQDVLQEKAERAFPGPLVRRQQG